MQIKLVITKPLQTKTQLLVIGTFQDSESPLFKELDKNIKNALDQAIKQKEFTGELLQTKLITTLGTAPFDHLLVIGLGKQKEFDIEKLRKAAAQTALIARDLGLKKFTTTLHTTSLTCSVAEKTLAVVIATHLALYHFSSYKTVDRDKIKTVDVLELVQSTPSTEVEHAINEATILSEATCFVRDLVNEPASHLMPAKVADIAKTLPKQVHVTVYDKKAIAKMGMHALLAVNRGSIHEPRLVVLEYNGSKDAPIALVGKGVTFDSGGLNIKPETGMETMKMDMAGAAAVLGTFKAAALLKLPIHLVGVLPLTENMLGCDAYKPGDVFKTYDGKTIEIINTDAEGRVILADALSYAETFKPKLIIDLATLTGACVVALGHTIAGIMSTDKKLIQELITAGQISGERLWELPLYDEFKEAVKSDIADVRNLSIWGRDAGAITAAAFLANFIKETPWAHLDIAGTAWSSEDKGYFKKGGTGFGVQLLINYLQRR